MTGTFVALWLAAIATEVSPGMAGNGPALIIDPCVDVDEGTVREVMELEIRGTRMLPISVGVRCIDGAQEIRVLTWGSPPAERIRTIQLPTVVDDDDAAARQARSRELALAIAEYIRRLDTAEPHPRAAEPTSVSTLPPPVPAPAMPAAEPLDRRWGVGVLSAVDHFSSGRTLVGGDLFVVSDLGRWASAELRAGGRLGADEALPGGFLTTRAATAGAAVGFNLWSQSRSVGGALVLRAQGYLVQFRVEQVGVGRSPTAVLGAFTLGAEPRLSLQLTRHISFGASAGVGLPIRGIVVNLQGRQTRGMSGLVVSGSFSAVVSF